MPQITRDTLMPLETYARARPEFRARVMSHKKDRALRLGANLTLIFEDELTIRYQIQEMLRVERIFEEQGIMDELEAYEPLIPDGSNWKATMMIEYPDENERRQMLAQLIGVEDRVWVQVQGRDRVYAIADEDLEREKGFALFCCAKPLSDLVIEARMENREVKANFYRALGNIRRLEE